MVTLHGDKSTCFLMNIKKCPWVTLPDNQKMSEDRKKHLKKPDWLKIRLPGGKNFAQVKEIVEGNKLHTICTSGNCPNMGKCWNTGTATFMILGDICTRSCRFCASAGCRRTAACCRINKAYETQALCDYLC